MTPLQNKAQALEFFLLALINDQGSGFSARVDRYLPQNSPPGPVSCARSALIYSVNYYSEPEQNDGAQIFDMVSCSEQLHPYWDVLVVNSAKCWSVLAQ